MSTAAVDHGQHINYMSISKKVVFVLAFLVIATFAYAAEKEAVSVRAEVDRKTIYIGDRIRYSVEVVADKKVDVEFPKYADDRIGDFEIKDSGKSKRVSIFAKKIYSNWYSITAYSIGKHAIPEFAVKYRQKGKKDWNEKKTKPIEVSVVSILPQDQVISDIKDIKGPLYFKEVNWPLILAVVAVLFGVAAVIVYMRRASRLPPKLPHETALEELESIKGLYLKGGDVKEYYVGVSDCVRRYIERVFKLKAPEMTTEEFLNSLPGSASLNIGQKDLLKDFLKACDLVKFAKYAPTAAEAEGVYASAKKFIEETKDVHI